MRSRDLFTQPSKAVRPRRPVPIVAALSILLPGTGHMLLGRFALGCGLLAAVILAPAAAFALRHFAPEPFGVAAWLIGRIGVISAVFAIIDAPLSAREPRWIKRSFISTPPRLAGFLNMVGYGTGHLRMGESFAGGWAIALGGVSHFALVLFAPMPWIVLAELIPAGLAYWGHRQATEIANQRVKGDQNDGSLGTEALSKSVMPLAPLPAWLRPVQAATTAAVIASAIVAWSWQGLWLDSRHVDSATAVAVEPYYQHPDHGISIEMRAPGWSFRDHGANVFVDARHVAESSRLQLSLHPRVPGFTDASSAATTLASFAAENGLELGPVRSETRRIAGVDVIALSALARRGTHARTVEALVLDRGFRRYLIQMEWDSDHARFGRGEWDAMLHSLRVDDLPIGAIGESVAAR